MLLSLRGALGAPEQQTHSPTAAGGVCPPEGRRRSPNPPVGDRKRCLTAKRARAAGKARGTELGLNRSASRPRLLIHGRDDL